MEQSSWAANNVVQKSILELIPYDRNPKVHPESQIIELANSLRQWGWTMPILIDEAGLVIAGHGRLYAAQSLGIETVPCVVAHGWSEEKKKAYVIADNKLAEKGAWDNSLLYSELKDINETGFDLALMGMEDVFKLMEFTPNFDPSFSHTTVDDASISKASENMQNHIDALQDDKSEAGVEVMCPYCTETFRFTGV